MKFSRSTVEDLAWLPLICLIAYVIFFAVGKNKCIVMLRAVLISNSFSSNFYNFIQSTPHK